MKPLCIINRQSGLVSKKGSILEPLATKHNIPIAETNYLKTALNEQHDWIIVEGGDGTFQTVLTAFLRAKDRFENFPKFTLIAGGSTNQVPRHLGLRRHQTKRLEALLKGHEAQSLSSSLICFTQGHEASHFGFLFSTGALPEASNFAVEKIHGKGVKGGTAVAATIARAVVGFRTSRDALMPPSPIRLQAQTFGDDIIIDDIHLGTIVTTLPSIIFWLDPFYTDKSSTEPCLRMLYAGDKTRMLAWHALNLAVGTKQSLRKEPSVESVTAKAITFDYAGPIVIDGEPLPSGQFTLRPSDPVTFLR